MAAVSERQRVQQVPIFRSLFFSPLFEGRALTIIQTFLGNQCQLWLAIREMGKGASLIDRHLIQELSSKISDEEFVLYLVKEIVSGRYRAGDPILEHYGKFSDSRILKTSSHCESLGLLSAALVSLGHIKDGFMLAQKTRGSGVFQAIHGLILGGRCDLARLLLTRVAAPDLFPRTLFFSGQSIESSDAVGLRIQMFQRFVPEDRFKAWLGDLFDWLVEQGQTERLLQLADDWGERYSDEQIHIRATLAISFLKAGRLEEASLHWKQVENLPNLKSHLKFRYFCIQWMVQDNPRKLIREIEHFFANKPKAIRNLIEDRTFFEVFYFLYFKKGCKQFVVKTLLKQKRYLNVFFRVAIEILFSRGEPQKAVEWVRQLMGHFSMTDFLNEMFSSYFLHGRLQQIKMMEDLPYEVEADAEVLTCAKGFACGALGILFSTHRSLSSQRLKQQSLAQICRGLFILVRSQVFAVKSSQELVFQGVRLIR